MAAVREKAEELNERRNCPQRYYKVKSRVQMNMKSQKSSKNKKSPEKMGQTQPKVHGERLSTA